MGDQKFVCNLWLYLNCSTFPKYSHTYNHPVLSSDTLLIHVSFPFSQFPVILSLLSFSTFLSSLSIPLPYSVPFYFLSLSPPSFILPSPFFPAFRWPLHPPPSIRFIRFPLSPSLTPKTVPVNKELAQICVKLVPDLIQTRRVSATSEVSLLHFGEVAE